MDDLGSVLRVLKQFKKGYFVFTDEQGDQFVVARREEFEPPPAASEQQLSLPALPRRNLSSPSATMGKSADDVLERMNREIAVYQAQKDEDDLALSPSPRRVRFEPLKGDLPPELQE